MQAAGLKVVGTDYEGVRFRYGSTNCVIKVGASPIGSAVAVVVVRPSCMLGRDFEMPWMPCMGLACCQLERCTPARRMPCCSALLVPAAPSSPNSKCHTPQRCLHSTAQHRHSPPLLPSCRARRLVTRGARARAQGRACMWAAPSNWGWTSPSTHRWVGGGPGGGGLLTGHVSVMDSAGSPGEGMQR